MAITKCRSVEPMASLPETKYLYGYVQVSNEMPYIKREFYSISKSGARSPVGFLYFAIGRSISLVSGGFLDISIIGDNGTSDSASRTGAFIEFSTLFRPT